MSFLKYLELTPEIEAAVKEKKPIVALESTILSHGLPYPENYEFASKVEEIIRADGAIPATTAILGGKLKVGLTLDELEHMCKSDDIGKISRRDVATYLALNKDGATTVATTMLIASLAGIRVFATGGIGGVHRGASVSFDISADLQELANKPVAVVCAGAKSLLDIGLTLEYLETFGVPVLGVRTDKFPAFYCRNSGFDVDHRVNDEEEIANILHTKWEVGLKGGVVIANPIPEEFALDFEEMEEAINKALALAEAQGIHGKATTPFLLEAIKNITDGASLTSNLELAYNNARVAAKISVAYQKRLMD